MALKTKESIAAELKAFFEANGYGSDFGEGLTKLADYLNTVIFGGIEMAREADAKLIEELRDDVHKSKCEASKYISAFNRLKGAVHNFVEGTHWVLRLGVLGCSFWFMGWRWSAGVAAFILADELIRWGKREVDEIEP